MKAGFRLTAWAFLWLAAGLPLGAQSQLVDMYDLLDGALFPENYEVRGLLSDALTAPAYTALRTPSARYDQAITPGMQVAFDVRKTDDSFYLIFRNGTGEDFPTAARGNWIIKRELSTGDVIQVKIFLLDEENSFVRIYPDGRRVTMEVYLYNRKIYSDIPLSISMNEVLLSPFARLMRLSEPYIDWQTLFTDVSWGEWSHVGRLAAEASDRLYLMNEAEDGCQDALGEFVYIENGVPQGSPAGFNCSGFAKWVADGFWAGWNGTPEGPWLDPETLKTVRPGSRGEGNPWSSKLSVLDPYFGLDWVRNMALELHSASTGMPSGDPVRFDLKEIPFHKFVPEVGYEISGLESLLYLAAIKNPGYVFFGVISSPPGDSSGLRKYHHVAVFYPWFTPDGDFRVTVLDTGEVSSARALASRFPASHILLVRVRPPADFLPPPLR
jgi:hypothetical protein